MAGRARGVPVPLVRQTFAQSKRDVVVQSAHSKPSSRTGAAPEETCHQRLGREYEELVLRHVGSCLNSHLRLSTPLSHEVQKLVFKGRRVLEA